MAPLLKAGGRRYFAMMVANLMRIRLQLYESLLSEALAIKHES